jgi:hypothetical protein
MNLQNENGIKVLQILKQSIEALCLENEILRLILQENWPTAQRLPPLAVLNQGCKESEAEFHSRSRIADTKLAAIADVPAPCEEILVALAEWIQQTRKQTLARVESAKGTI